MAVCCDRFVKFQVDDALRELLVVIRVSVCPVSFFCPLFIFLLSFNTDCKTEGPCCFSLFLVLFFNHRSSS